MDSIERATYITAGSVERWSDDPAYQSSVQRAPIKSILLLKLDHIGDFVLAFDAMLAMREAFPEARIELACGPWNRELAESLGIFDQIHAITFFNPRADGVHPPFDPASIGALGQRVYDVVVDLRVDGDTRDVLRYILADFKAGFEAPNCDDILDLALPHRLPSVSRVNIGLHQTFLMLRLARSVADIFVRKSGARDVLLNKVAVDTSFDLSVARDRTLVVCNTSSGRVAKNWPLAYFQRLVRWLVHDMDTVVLLIGSKDQLADAQTIMDACQSPDVLSAVGRTSLRQAVSLIERGTIFVGNDSGLTHIAAQLGKPTVAMISGIDPPSMWAPIGKHVTVLRAPVSCSPCHISSVNECQAALACTTGISEAVVRAAIRPYLVSTSGTVRPRSLRGQMVRVAEKT